MKNSFKQYLLAGTPFIIIGLILNPWLVSWRFHQTFSTTIFSGILFISIILIIIGWGIIYKKQKFLSWLYEKYKKVALILLNLIVLFGVANFIAALILYKPVISPDKSAYFYDPVDLFRDSIQFIRKIYPDKSDAEIKELIMFKNPYMNHPVLEFQERVQSSDVYNVGYEGIRFDQKVNKNNANSVINGAVWVFGGSTTFGQGVEDDETITAYLNRMDTTNTYINFGVHAYYQSNEIEKLLLLLKKGYRPSGIIFIDGLNDITRMIETNFYPLETPALAKNGYSSDFNIATKESGNTVFKQLPVIRLLRSMVGTQKGPDQAKMLPWNQYDDVYNPDNLYNVNPRQHFQSTILRSPYSNIDTSALNYIVWKLDVLYRFNYRFIEKITKAYNIPFTVYYQPIGILSTVNPFWIDSATIFKSPLFVNFNYMVPKIREKIKHWNFPSFIDISDVDDSCGNCYVDLTHYSPELNRIIAETILKTQSSIIKTSSSKN